MNANVTTIHQSSNHVDISILSTCFKIRNIFNSETSSKRNKWNQVPEDARLQTRFVKAFYNL